jgi:integrase/recombinase XerD
LVTRLDVVVAAHLDGLAVRGYAATTLRQRRHHLAGLVGFLAEWGVTEPEAVTPALLEAYQRHLYRHRTAQGEPLSFRTQAQRLIPVKGFFAWLVASGQLPADPAAAIVLPRVEHRLPEAVLSQEEVEAVLAVPDTTTPLGVRDRAVLEVLWSSAVRRAELVALRLQDVDFARGTLFVRKGKGGRDRHVPVGASARRWVARYRDDVRPELVSAYDAGVLFLTSKGTAFSPDVLSRTVAAYLRAGAPERSGSCHLFRHTAATLMLDNGADIRHVGELLGHAKLETTQIYTRVSLRKLREVHAAFHPAERDRSPVPTA